MTEALLELAEKNSKKKKGKNQNKLKQNKTS